jgi:hypothetical protein
MMNVQEVRSLCHTQNVNDSHNIKWSSVISLRYHYFEQTPTAADALASPQHSFYTCHKQLHHITPLLINLHVIQTHSTIVLTCCHQSIDGCCHNAATMLLITCADKLTFVALWAKGYMYVSVTLWSK